MSLFNWFSKKTSHPASVAGSGKSPEQLRVKLAASTESPSAIQKVQRHAHREHLYKVVHDIMIRAGILAASYKFKVLSLDTRGLQYLIMMDMDNQSEGHTAHLTEIEAMMIQTAKARHNILVTSVYWRLTQGGQTASTAHPESISQKGSAFETLQQEEVDVFKRAPAGSSAPAAPAKQGQSATSDRRNPAPLDDFEDTQLTDSHEQASPLSMTQYGGLN